MSARSVALDDLGYELRLLAGADEIVRFMEAQDAFGNLVNYFKDSVYLHARNLLNALTNGYETEIGTIPSTISSATYGKVKDPLERYVMHTNKARDQRGVSNVRAGKHLNEYVHELTAEAKRCWNDWTAATGDRRLTELMQSAEKQAQDDLAQLRGLLK